MHENSSPQANFFNIWDAKIHYCKGNLAFRISKFSKISACGGLFSHHKVGKNSRFSHQGLKYGGKKSLFFPTRVPHYGGKKTLEFSFSHHYGGKKIPLSRSRIVIVRNMVVLCDRRGVRICFRLPDIARPRHLDLGRWHPPAECQVGMKVTNHDV